VDLSYLPAEHLGETETDRKAIFDIYCKADQGDHLVIEMQKNLYYIMIALNSRFEKSYTRSLVF